MLAAKRLLAGLLGATIEVEIEGYWQDANVDDPFEYTFTRHNAEVKVGGGRVFAKFNRGYGYDNEDWRSVEPSKTESTYHKPALFIRLEIK